MDETTAGAIAMGYAVAALFFFRFWRDSRDRLFALFALAFVILAANRVGMAQLGGEGMMHSSPGYWVRFAAFALILLAILDKNWSRGGRR